MVRIAFVGAFLALSGCGEGVAPNSDASTALDMASRQQRSIAALESKVATLEEDLRQVNKRYSTLYNYVKSTDDSLVSLRGTFNRNVDQGNEEKARAATARGYCGQETYVDDAGVTRLRNRDCKVSDLPPPRK